MLTFALFLILILSINSTIHQIRITEIERHHNEFLKIQIEFNENVVKILKK